MMSLVLLQRELKMEEQKLWKLRPERVRQLCQWLMLEPFLLMLASRALMGSPDVVECSFVQSNVTELPFFASKVRLGKNGVEEVLGLVRFQIMRNKTLKALSLNSKHLLKRESILSICR